MGRLAAADFTRISVVLIAFLLLYFVCMDRILYNKLQSIPPLRPPPHLNGSSNVGVPLQSSEGTAALPGTSHRTPPQPSAVSKLFSPFEGLSIKLMMMDHFNHYIATPISYSITKGFNLETHLLWITPNLLSLVGVVLAVLAARCISWDGRGWHLAAVALMMGRDLMDALDGMVARDRRGIRQHRSLHDTAGYFVDGVADTAGYTFFLLGCFAYLRSVNNLKITQNHRNNNGNDSIDFVRLVSKVVIVIKVTIYEVIAQLGNPICQDTSLSFRRNVPKQYQPLLVLYQTDEKVKRKSETCPPSPTPGISGPGTSWTSQRIFLVLCCLGIQVAASAVLWDRYCQGYYKLLETPRDTEPQAIVQNEILKSTLMWLVIWLWRVFNSHALINWLLVSIVLNKMWDFLIFIQFIGIAAITTLFLFTEIHFRDVTAYVNMVP